MPAGELEGDDGCVEEPHLVAGERAQEGVQLKFGVKLPGIAGEHGRDVVREVVRNLGTHGAELGVLPHRPTGIYRA